MLYLLGYDTANFVEQTMCYEIYKNSFLAAVRD